MSREQNSQRVFHLFIQICCLILVVLQRLVAQSREPRLCNSFIAEQQKNEIMRLVSPHLRCNACFFFVDRNNLSSPGRLVHEATVMQLLRLLAVLAVAFDGWRLANL
ncbi:uncharacterized protein BCR38DRAFT_444138 [Pseudomassariella vexata]|uniref:Secreted protein n=1 Tax=Pseudomassariella vexata TaxID=1141098 RepID=A0A1Y2DLM6_9PEZI|nr:uncharacterized protein BCR38DRAFT_444138 [Pseudomassariella vexata]ORY60162.1 hypothetical protein BCR38DRAFT_444138 [Pseudomassariella vexata]